MDGGGYALIHPHGENTYGTQTLMRTTRAGIVSESVRERERDRKRESESDSSVRGVNAQKCVERARPSHATQSE